TTTSSSNTTALSATGSIGGTGLSSTISINPFFYSGRLDYLGPANGTMNISTALGDVTLGSLGNPVHNVATISANLPRNLTITGAVDLSGGPIPNTNNGGTGGKLNLTAAGDITIGAIRTFGGNAPVPTTTVCCTT